MIARIAGNRRRIVRVTNHHHVLNSKNFESCHLRIVVAKVVITFSHSTTKGFRLNLVTMEATQRFSDCENLKTPKMEDNECGKEQGDGSRPRRGSRRTRSQAAPDWSTMDSLILVNEIAAVEADCKEALSSYQKWKIIADNCTALDVVRNSNQCHRKWDSLLAQYNMIKQWETQSRSDSYWSLGSEQRKELGIPEDFDSELFDAIDNLVKAKEGRLDTDPDTDPEAEVEIVDVIAEPGSKKQRRRLMPQICNVVEKEEENNVEEEEPKNVEEEETSLEEKEGMLAAKLRENAELIHAILKGKVTDDMDCKLSELRKNEASRIEFTRRQGDKLIACFGDLVNTLNQLRDHVQ